MDAEREIVDGRALAAEIVNPDLRVGNTTVEPRLGVRLKTRWRLATLNTEHSRRDMASRLFGEKAIGWELKTFPTPHIRAVKRSPVRKKMSYLVLAVPVATSGTSSHFDGVLTWSVLVLVVGDFKSGPTRGVKGPPCRYPSDRGRWQ